MQDVSIWVRELTSAATQLFKDFIDYLPTLVGAILVLLLGWVLARLVRAVGVRLAHWFNTASQRMLGYERARYVHLSDTAIKLIGNITFWIIVLFFITIATQILGLRAFSDWLSRIVTYLPTVLAGALIILVGYVVSVLARDLTAAAVTSAGVGHSEILGRAAQGAILFTALIIGIDQIGIDVTLLITLIAIVVGAAFGSLSLAFALGSRSLVSNLIGSHYLQRHYQPGQVVRMGDVEGELLEVTPVSIVVATRDGRVVVPAKVFQEEQSALVVRDDDE